MSRPTISLRLDISWLPATALVLWWLATTALPDSLPESAKWEQWLLAALLALGLFVSVALHEIVRIGTGLRYGIEPRAFRLYPFGGIPQEDPGLGGPEAEFMAAVSGPATHLVYVKFEDDGDGGTTVTLRDSFFGAVAESMRDEVAVGWKAIYGGLKDWIEAR